MESQITDQNYEIIIPRWVRHSNHPISTVSIHPSGEIFATGGWDNYVKIWSFLALKGTENVKAKLISLLRDHTGTINCVRFSPDGKYLASCGDDSMIFIWQKARAFVSPSTFGFPESALKPNKPIQKWTSKSLSGHTSDVTSISWSPDSKRLVSHSVDGYIIVWDINTNTQIWCYRTNLNALSISWDPLNQFIAVQMSNGLISIFNTQGTLIKEVHDNLDRLPETPMFSRISWTADGSFIGTGGFDRSFKPLFFQRSTFNFSFSLEGHISSISCVSCSPILLRIDDNNYGTLIAVSDKTGVISIWLIGSITVPLFVIERISTSSINDISWSNDGKYLLIALENDPLQHIGGIICIHFQSDLPYQCAEPAEIEEVKKRLLGETSISRLKSGTKTSKSEQILKSLEDKENDIGLEVLQLTTEEVMNRQIEQVIDGVHIIQPVLLTAVEKQLISFRCQIPGIQTTKIPKEFIPLEWPKPSSLSSEPNKIIELDDSILLSSDSFVYKLNKKNGRRVTTPFCIGAKCKHLSVMNELVLAVGDMIYLLELQSLKCITKIKCSKQFTDFGVLPNKTIYASAQGKIWIYDIRANTWVGGGVTNKAGETSLKDVEVLARWKKYEMAAERWSEVGMDAVLEAYSGNYERGIQKLETIRDENEDELVLPYIENMIESLKARWG
ncbi:histone chaperone HIRA [Histomonas meleagridis]|uniref:histone chaperone HIRA n=1 Tax=Histomonas meleagridis TaxID=135588 RepID=UPI0035594D8B|nr:histone chaperone HIRA [Histomonas meleagridis]KAH0804400.1 histone chaperone HIRA [Histomonas meleagridis]